MGHGRGVEACLGVGVGLGVADAVAVAVGVAVEVGVGVGLGVTVGVGVPPPGGIGALIQVSLHFSPDPSSQMSVFEHSRPQLLP